MPRGIERAELRALMANGVQLVEVLPDEEYRDDHLPGARSLPLTRLDADSAAALDRTRTVVVYCWDLA